MRPSGLDRRVNAVLAALLTVLSVAVPLMDRGGPGSEPAVHAEHPLSAHAAHDHTICTQHSASPWLTLDAVVVAPRPEEAPAQELALALHPVPTPYAQTSRSRAPPIL